jgi:hypothetical protein
MMTMVSPVVTTSPFAQRSRENQRESAGQVIRGRLESHPESDSQSPGEQRNRAQSQANRFHRCQHADRNYHVYDKGVDGVGDARVNIELWVNAELAIIADESG